MSTLRSRGYLPHLENENSIYFVTYRLSGSLPQSVLEQIKSERADILSNAKSMNRNLTKHEYERLKQLTTDKIESYLDQGFGKCWLKDPQVASVVMESLKFANGTKYDLFAWCIMPNHVHVVFRLYADEKLARVLHSWKSFTGHRINKILAREGEFWNREYYDHIIRNDSELMRTIQYTLENPVKAGLCNLWHEWPWSGVLVKSYENAGERSCETL